ncbi:MAG: hypothetical protein ACI8Z7_000715 [Candidatus Nanohaloarchaea archaeon]|jgi:hypothetical protein
MVSKAGHNYKILQTQSGFMIDLVTLDLVLDIILKLIFIAVLIFVFILLKNLDQAVQSLERSLGSMERSAETVEDVVAIMRKIPFVGGGKRDDK